MQLRERAERIAQTFASLRAVEAVFLFGSVARGDLHEASDIDLLILGSDVELSPAVLLHKLPDELRDVKLSLLYYSLDEFRQMLATASPFAKHLRLEARILYDPDGVLAALLKDMNAYQEMDVKRELQIRMTQLSVYNDLEMFKGNFLFVLSDLYSIGKSVVMLALVVEGTPEFNREAAFARFVERHPEMISEVETVARLRPFYLLVTRQVSDQLPFSRYGVECEVRDVTTAIRRLAGVLE